MKRSLLIAVSGHRGSVLGDALRSRKRVADSDIACERWFALPCESLARRCVWCGPFASDDAAVARRATAVPRLRIRSASRASNCETGACPAQ